MMRILPALFLALAMPVLAQEAPKPRELSGTQPAKITNPNQICELVDKFMQDFIEQAAKKGKTPEEAKTYHDQACNTVKYWRFVAWCGVPEATKERPTFFRDSILAAEWWFNNMHFATTRVEFRTVPNSNGLVRWFDLREPGWSEAAWSSVARRDLMFREPQIDTIMANRLRLRAGMVQDPKTLHVESIVWGPQLFRDTVEGQRSPSYYDLLFSEFRFIQEKTEYRSTEARKEKRTVTHTGGDFKFPDDSGREFKNLAPGNYVVELEFKAKTEAPLAGNAKFVDFPQTAEDWEKIFKRKPAAAKTLGKRSELRYLAIVAGMHDDAAKGSFVAFRNRLLEFSTGNFEGPYMETFDVEDGTNKQDFVEQSLNIVRGHGPDFDAQERLAGLPAGGQAALLNNGKLKRIEAAAAKVARGIPAKPGMTYIYSPEVRNPGDCVRCHAVTYGVIDPSDLIKQLVLDKDGKGVADANFYDPADLINYKGAFRELKKRNEGWRTGYRELVEESTEKLDKPWTGKELVDAFEWLWNWYDTPVALAQASHELGVPEEIIKQVTDQTLVIRSRQLQRGQAIPRQVWDKDVRPMFWKFVVERRQEKFPAPAGFLGIKP